MRMPEPLGRADLPAEVESVPLARRYVRDLLDRIDHKQTDDALLLVSELFTNAVRHSDSGRHPDGRVSVAVTNQDGTLHIDVIDAGSTGQTPRICSDVDPDSGSGRGLWLVQELSASWGWYETPTGRVVWFQLSET
ncbi:ATP-binding protein [Streptosporangium sp. NPDC000509]|uniref:ATP-binding protein n=1 Tax=Streptosporangium sp. NPDC000509 TaxID=3366186 RepID=UPI003696215B